jgi:hypothetical protein
MAGESSATDAGGPGWDWDVALSFAGAQRKYVEQAFSDSRRTLGTGGADGKVHIWDVAPPAHPAIIPGRPYQHTCNGRRTEGG